MEKPANNYSTLLGQYAAILSITEVGVGSLVHSLRIPFSGHTLSLNQGLILTRATLKLRDEKSRMAPATVSNIAALLKSLSPAGKKLTPMLAISAQGLLFNAGTLIFGRNLVGVSIGMVLLSLWAFIQPVMLFYIMYGKAMIHIADYFFQKFQKFAEFDASDLIWVLAAVASVKILLALGVALVGARLTDRQFQKYEDQMLQMAKNRWAKRRKTPRSKNSFVLAWYDLMNPLFLFSLGITAVFFFFVSNDWTQMIWVLMRPLAVGYILFWLVRAIDFEKWLKRIREEKAESLFAQAAQSALNNIKQL